MGPIAVSLFYAVVFCSPSAEISVTFNPSVSRRREERCQETCSPQAANGAGRDTKCFPRTLSFSCSSIKEGRKEGRTDECKITYSNLTESYKCKCDLLI
ncbi:hypothetical protein PUN28_013246 [Cardiocondyla obscurior]|uniref:Secreted protein n=1 Tax=Cardiocondyla obscurior TaxID=286306 RepID=A0AAW2FCK6_9HYME